MYVYIYMCEYIFLYGIYAIYIIIHNNYNNQSN